MGERLIVDCTFCDEQFSVEANLEPESKAT